MTRATVGIIGVGVIGEEHLKALQGHQAAEVVGITDFSPALAEARSRQFGVPCFESCEALIKAARPDYVTVCTPHYGHTEVAILAMRHGVHALVEKPLTVSASVADGCLRVMRETGKTLGVGFVRRLHATHARMFELLQAGFVGEIQRVTMVRTNWFRSMAYYRSSPWRGTWKGEGGGILVNQAPHDLDLLLWTAGTPAEVLVELNTAGHDIQVEDDVCALMKWPNGATGTLHVSTQEAPGQSFYEIAGTRGTLRLEEGCLTATGLAIDARVFCQTTPEKMVPPPTGETMHFRPGMDEDSYCCLRDLHTDFVAAVRAGRPPVCPAEDGLREVERANAMHVSGLSRRWTPLTAPRDEYDRMLAGLIDAGSLREYKASGGL